MSNWERIHPHTMNWYQGPRQAEVSVVPSYNPTTTASVVQDSAGSRQYPGEVSILANHAGRRLSDLEMQQSANNNSALFIGSNRQNSAHYSV
jgi:hypothetical protein